MNENLIEIIKKQQELINLMIKSGIYGTSVQKIDFVEQQVCDISPVADKIAEEDIKEFAEWLKKKGSSQNCINTYTKQVELFYREFGEMNVETLVKYEEDIKSKYKPKTVNLKIAAMSKYFKFKGYSGFEFKRAKEQKRTFCDNAINKEQYDTFLKWAVENNKKVWLIAKVIGTTGVRVSELVSLKTNDLEKGYVDITGKGGKTRRIYFPKKLIAEIKDVCGDICGKEYLIENRYGQQMSTRGVATVLRYTGEKAGMPKEVMHPHSFRHFFAKEFLKNKNDITLLGDLLGHSDITTTAIYTRMTSEEQLNEINEIIDW